MKFKSFIEKYFLIDDAESGRLVPFNFRPVQSKYYDFLCRDYSEKENFKGLRETILKARKEGFTSLVLALFAADIIMNHDPVRYLEISYKEDATRQHYRRLKAFILSYFKKRTEIQEERELEKEIFDSISEGEELVLKHNKASFYVGTASTRTGERGGTVQGVLFSEAAHYPDTGIQKASEIIEATRNQIAVGSGMVFVETTANGMNHFYNLWNKAKDREVDYKPRFFSWKDFYTEEQFELIKKGFADKSLIKQEYPEFDYEAFLTSGRPVFNQIALKEYLDKARVTPPLAIGNLFGSSECPVIESDPNGLLRVYEAPQYNRAYVIGADPGDGHDFAVAQVLDHRTLSQVATWRGRIGADEFGRVLHLLGFYYNKALIAVERNGLGLGTISILKSLYYPNFYTRKVEDYLSHQETTDIGWVTNIKTRPELITLLQQLIREKAFALKDEITIKELMAFAFNEKGKAEAVTGNHDDTIFALGIGVMSARQTEHPNAWQQSDSYLDHINKDTLKVGNRVVPQLAWRIGK